MDSELSSGARRADTIGDGLGSTLDRYMSGRIDRRGFLKSVAVFGISASAASTLLAACGSTSSSGKSSAGSSSSSGTPVSGGTFREGYDRDFSPINPVYTAWDDPDFNALFEAVVIRDPEGNVVPMLADSFKSEATGWTFHIREGLKFQSGAPVTADAVAAAFKLFINPKIGENAVFWGPVKKITANGQNVICTTDHPFRALQETVTTENSYVMNPAAWKAQGTHYGTKPTDGTGPFVLSSYVPGQHVIAKRWEDYPGSIVPFFANKGKAYLDAIEWIPITQASQRAPQIQTNLVDAVKNVPPQDIDTLKSNSNLVVQEYQELSNFYLAVNLGNSQLGFTDIRVRRAISQAIDREEIVKSILLGHGAATYGPLMPNYKWYNPAVEKFNQFDTDQAEQLLEAAGWSKGSGNVREKNGQQLAFTTYHLSTDPENEVLQAVAAMLAKVGINMTVANVPQATFYAKLTPKLPSYANKWLWSSPIDVVEYYTVYEQPKTPIINSVYAAYAAWQRAATVDELKTAAFDYQIAVAETLPLIPIYTPNTTWVHTTKVVGWQPNQANIYPFYNDVWLKDA
jgi:peptide/nickel transport system substrate-binding protein